PLGFYLAVQLLDHFRQELLLGVEVVVEQPGRHAHLLGDLLHRGVLIALPAQDRSGRVHDLHAAISPGSGPLASLQEASTSASTFNSAANGPQRISQAAGLSRAPASSAAAAPAAAACARTLAPPRRATLRATRPASRPPRSRARSRPRPRLPARLRRGPGMPRS